MAHPPDSSLPRLTTKTLVTAFCDTAAGMTPTDFEVTIDPLLHADIVPSVSAVAPAGNSATIVFNRRIAPGRWTCVRHIESTRRCCLGSLCGDIDGNRISLRDDVFELFDNLNAAVNPPLAIKERDVDRSSLRTPADLRMAVDLLGSCNLEDGGPGTLPVCPSVSPPP